MSQGGSLKGIGTDLDMAVVGRYRFRVLCREMFFEIGGMVKFCSIPEVKDVVLPKCPRALGSYFMCRRRREGC